MGSAIHNANGRPQRTVAVRDDFITLGQLLKVAGTISSGGAARPYLAEHTVLVNGEPENRRGRKLRPGDQVQVEGGPLIRISAPRPTRFQRDEN